MKDLNSPDEKSDNFNRTWFQDFFKFLNNNVPLTNLKQINDINVFPDSLKNAVLEEHAKNEIYNLYEEKKWLKWEYNHKVKGIIKNISTGHGTLLIDIIPFSYSSHDFIDECKRGSEIISIKSNPFYYTDSLNNWTCTKLNPVTGEILKFEFE